MLGAAASGANDATPAAPASSGPDWLTGTIAQITVIVLGVILIIAGLFQFKQVQEVVQVAAVV